jgi:hypothetical protein
MGWWTGHILYYSLLHPKLRPVACPVQYNYVTSPCAISSNFRPPPTKVLSNVVAVKVENGFKTRDVFQDSLEYITPRWIPC